MSMDIIKKISSELIPVDLHYIEEIEITGFKDDFEDAHRISIPKYGFVSLGIKVPANPISTIIDPSKIYK